jgi:hypothetical protein
MVRQNRCTALPQVHTYRPDHQNQFMGHQVSSSPPHFHSVRILSIHLKDRNRYMDRPNLHMVRRLNQCTAHLPSLFTVRHPNQSTAHHRNLRTVRHPNLSTAHHRNRCTAHHPNLSTAHHRNLSTAHHRNLSTAHHRNLSTAHHLNPSTVRRPYPSLSMDLLSLHQRLMARLLDPPLRMVHLLRPVILMDRRQVSELHQRLQKSSTTDGNQYPAWLPRFQLIRMVHRLVEALLSVPRRLLQVTFTVPHQATNMGPHPRQVTHMVLRLEDYPMTNMDHRHRQ